jgi:hypothetical protein
MGLILFVWSQIVLIPILGGILLGMRTETRRRERQIQTVLKALGLFAITHKHK